MFGWLVCSLFSLWSQIYSTSLKNMTCMMPCMKRYVCIVTQLNKLYHSSNAFLLNFNLCALLLFICFLQRREVFVNLYLRAFPCLPLTSDPENSFLLNVIAGCPTYDDRLQTCSFIAGTAQRSNTPSRSCVAACSC